MTRTMLRTGGVLLLAYAVLGTILLVVEDPLPESPTADPRVIAT